MLSRSACSGLGSAVRRATCSPALVYSTTTRHYNRHTHYNEGNYRVHRHLRYSNSKHKDPRYKLERGLKVQPIELIDFHEPDTEDLTPQEIRMKMKQRGVLPHRPWQERPLTMSCTMATIDQYVPPEGDARASLVSKEGARQSMTSMGNKGKNFMALRKITRNYDEDFDIKDFAFEAQDIYIKAHEALSARNYDRLHELATERAYPRLTDLTKGKTIRWRFIKSVESPRAVQVRMGELVDPGNVFGQVTVRLHTQQTLAIYDRFGNLIHGSEAVAVNSLEYVVFEKHVASTHGVWRLHDRIVPEWAPEPPPAMRTYKEAPEAEAA